MNRDQYVTYLRTMLIPDLIANGSNTTAADFIAAVMLLENELLVYADYERIDYEIEQGEWS